MLPRLIHGQSYLDSVFLSGFNFPVEYMVLSLTAKTHENNHYGMEFGVL